MKLHRRFLALSLLCVQISATVGSTSAKSKDVAVAPSNVVLECNDSDPDCKSSHPASGDSINDLDHDGVVEVSEINEVKNVLHDLFDMDDSGGLEGDEIACLVDCDNDVDTIYSKLDKNHDSIISNEELEGRWEHVGAELTVEEVYDWMSFAVQLPQYADLFRRNYISGYSFPLLMEKDGARLKDLGVTNSLHREQIVKFMKKKILGSGSAPKAVKTVNCETESNIEEESSSIIHMTWKPDDTKAQRYQLQVREGKEGSWRTLYTGSGTEFTDLEDTNVSKFYRLATWNSYGRSHHVHVHCNFPAHHHNETEYMIPMNIWSYAGWLDEIGLVLLLIFLPYRLLVYGELDFVLKLFRRLPPNMPISVIVKRDGDTSVIISWTCKSNGVRILNYVVRWMNYTTKKVYEKRLHSTPLKTEARISNLNLGDTYRFTVVAVNEFGLSTESTAASYLVPLIASKKERVPSFTIKKKLSLERNKCYVCMDPESKKVSVFKKLDKKILHFCSVCDREFCQAHCKKVTHSRTMSCPAVGGSCVCMNCTK